MWLELISLKAFTPLSPGQTLLLLNQHCGEEDAVSIACLYTKPTQESGCKCLFISVFIIAAQMDEEPNGKFR